MDVFWGHGRSPSVIVALVVPHAGTAAARALPP